MKSSRKDSVPVGCESVSLGVFFLKFRHSQYLYFDLKMEIKQYSETSSTTHLLTQPQPRRIEFAHSNYIEYIFLGVVPEST